MEIIGQVCIKGLLISSFFLKFKSNLLVKRVFFLLNAAFAMAILDLISRIHLPSFVNILSSYLTENKLCLPYKEYPFNVA